MDFIVIRGARENNLCSIDLDLPRRNLIVLTGLSGSGKSSLAFDTIYAEGQRRYVESLSTYARQFLDRLARPDVDTIEGLSPAISIEQRGLGKSPRSTVGTVTEIYDYLRLLYARFGEPTCPSCQKSLSRQSSQEIVEQVMSLPEGTRLSVLAPLVRGRKGAFAAVIERLRLDGYTRVGIDGVLYDLAEEIALDPHQRHTIDVYIDRLVLKAKSRSRLSESVELALQLADGLAKISTPDGGAGDGQDLIFSEHLVCHDCELSFPEVTPRLFSFNSPDGACPACSGLGQLLEVDEALVVPDGARSLRDGALEPWNGRNAAFHQKQLEAVAEHFGFSLVTPFEKLSAKVRGILLNGSDEPITFVVSRGKKQSTYKKTFEGIIPFLQRRYEELKRKEGRNADSVAAALDDDEDGSEEIAAFMSRRECASCGGARLRAEALSVRLAGRNIAELCALPAEEALSALSSLELSGERGEVARKLSKAACERLRFLVGVGVGYLSIDRPSATLSGGEGQRVRLATQIGSSLVGVLYVLDEPSIGLHQRDNERLLDTLRRLRDLGNTVIVVEHDEETIRAADYLVDLGPGAGVNGGRVVALRQRRYRFVTPSKASLTGAYLTGRRAIDRNAAQAAVGRSLSG
jgi:excinuclease ABC subunit A